MNKEERKIYQRKYREKNPQKYDMNCWQRRLKALYNITHTEYFELLDRQGGVCAICGTVNENGWRLAVDHDHSCCPGNKSCGECVRGLLCSNCNQGLGKFKDNPDLLLKAFEYVNTV